VNTAGVNDMTRAAGILAEARRLVPDGPYRCEPLGARRFPQRITGAEGKLVAECYEDPDDGIRIGPYLALLVPDFTEAVVILLGRKGAEWDGAVEWKDGSYVHAGGCTGIVGHDTRDDGCGCFSDALGVARAVLEQAAAGERAR
jgi:hypothetical protein